MASKTYIYRDMVSGCEMFSVAHPHSLMAGNDAVLCVQSAMINENGDTIDVGGGNHFGGEDADAAPLDDGGEIVNNIICKFGCGILKKVGPKRQNFWPRINILKGKFFKIIC